MWSNFKSLSSDLLPTLQCIFQSKRTTYILKRKYPVKLNKLGAMFPKKLRKRSFYYDLVEDTNVKAKPPVEVVLIKDVPGFGLKGEKIQGNMLSVYKYLLLPKLALYSDSPELENLQIETGERQFSSKFSKAVENHLAKISLPIIMSHDKEWTLEKWHVRSALRQAGVLTNDDCITIPKPISGPDLKVQDKDFLIQLTINKMENFLIRCRIYLWSSINPALNRKALDLDLQTEPLFPDEAEKINELLAISQKLKKSNETKFSTQKKKKRRSGS